MTINKKQYKATLKTHRNEIKQLRKDIKTHKLLIKQARTMWKVAKIRGAKVSKKATSTKDTNRGTGREGLNYEL